MKRAPTGKAKVEAVARPLPVQAAGSSTVLIVVSNCGSISHGTGFVVAVSDVGAEQGQRTHWVLTCAHVISQDPKATISVNGCGVSGEQIRVDTGLDLALLEVNGLKGLSPLRIAQNADHARSGWTHGSYYGFGHLYSTYYAGTYVDYDVKRSIALQSRNASTSVLGYEFVAKNPGDIAPGHSGSALLNTQGEVVAILTSKMRESDRAIALSILGARRVWPDLGSLFGIDMDGGEDHRLIANRPLTGNDLRALKLEKNAKYREQFLLSQRSITFSPPPAPTTTDPEDPNVGRFGKKAQDAGVRLKAVLQKRETTQSYFVFDLIVEPTAAQTTLSAAKFFLHPSFSPSVITIRKPDSKGRLVLADIVSYGVFHAGCQAIANGDEVLLELNIADLPGLPERFKSQ